MADYSIEKFIRKLREDNAWYAQQAAPAPEDARGVEPSGVNVCGYFRDESGWGAAGRGYVRALRALNFPHALLDLSTLSSNRSEDTTLDNFDSRHPFNINLVCVDAGQHYAFASQVGEEFFEGRYNVGLWAWELPRFPEKWYDRFAFYDEIWVGTSFIASALAPISPVPVVRVPPVLVPRTRGSRERGRVRLGLDDAEFTFLFIFDFHSHLQRKNPLALIDAFKSAFAPSESARLIIKCVNETSDPKGFEALRERASGASATIHAGYWSAEEMQDLMAACDAYVSLHRSEGTGLTITDAMAYGKPVIATGWSGNMDFMNVSNSYPVRYRLVEITETVGPYRAGETWADASTEHAAELMRRAFENRDEASALGRAAQREIEENYSEEMIAALMRRRLNVIASRDRFALFKRESKAFREAYARLIEKIRETVNAKLPEGSTLLVISKGDPALLRFSRCRAAHFPQSRSGQYAGHYPATGAEALAHLLEVQEREGAQYLVVPATSGWWMEHYREMGRYLEGGCEQVLADAHCRIFRLAEGEADSHADFLR